MTAEQTIVVTGMGVANAAGDGLENLWQSVARGVSPAVLYADPTVPGSLAIPACVTPGSGAALRKWPRGRQMDRCVQLALEAAFQAHADADLHERKPDSSMLGIMAGTSRGPMQKWTETLQRVQSGQQALPPTLTANSTLACISGALSMALEACGPCLTVSATCASSAHAVALAAQQIQLGAAEVMVAGGTDAPLQDAVIRQIHSTGILGSHADPRQACRPFDLTRNGTVLGEGAGFLVLESLASARRRGVRVHARLLGWAIGSDSAHRTAPRADGEGLLQVMRRALQVGGLGAEQIDHVNLHGTGTRINDRVEALALRRLLGDRLLEVACNSIKPVTGHCLGASAALEAIVSILSLQKQIVCPTANCRDLDPECSLDLVTGEARPRDLRIVMSNSLGFWGKNASLVFGRAEAA